MRQFYLYRLNKTSFENQFFYLFTNIIFFPKNMVGSRFSMIPDPEKNNTTPTVSGFATLLSLNSCWTAPDFNSLSRVMAELKLLEVIYTCDGKEYLTHYQLTREIKDEVYLAGGRAR